MLYWGCLEITQVLDQQEMEGERGDYSLMDVRVWATTGYMCVDLHIYSRNWWLPVFYIYIKMYYNDIYCPDTQTRTTFRRLKSIRQSPDNPFGTGRPIEVYRGITGQRHRKKT